MKAVQANSRLNTRLFGDPESYTPANRSVNAICVVTFAICLLLLPFNIIFGLTAIVILLIVMMVGLAVVYYFSRVLKKHDLSAILYAIGSYITVGITYFFNAGIDGPSLLLFFLTFCLLIGFTKKKFHKYWVILHLVLGSGFVISEYYFPKLIKAEYNSAADRYIDYVSSYCIALFFIYLIIVYLRKAYSTERKLVLKRSAELEQINEQKTKLFSIIAHDLKTPLNGLLGYLELLNTYGIPSEQKQVVEKQLLASTKQTSEMLTNLLYWAKAQMDGIKPSITTLPLNKTVLATIASLKPTAEAKNVNLHFHINETLNVYADKDMLLLVIRNLVHNAIKFTPAKGSVIISSETHPKFVRIVIIDNGVGIPEEKRADLFSIKTKSSFGTDREKGFGLGLLLCKEFTELQNGSIGYASMENKGSKFYIDLPAAPASASAALQQKPMPMLYDHL